MDRELRIVGAAAVVALVLAIWRINAVGRIRAVLADLDRMTVEDDGEAM